MSSSSFRRSGSLPTLVLMLGLHAAAVAQPAPSPDPAPVEPAPAEPAPSPDPAPAEPAPSPEPAPVDAEITVVGVRYARAPGSAHVVGAESLERRELDDPHAVLQHVPGVYIRQEDGVGLRPNIGLRGANADRSKKITLLEDGILFGPAPYSAPAAYFFPLMTRMTELRVLKGPAAIAHGPHTVGGAIDLVTRSVPVQDTATLDLGYGSFGYSKLHGVLGSSTDQTGFVVEGVHLHDDGFKDLPRDADTGSSRNEWMLKTFYLVDPDAEVSQELRLKLSYSDEASNETYLGLTDADFRADPYRRYPASALDRMDAHRTQIVLSHVLDAPDLGLQLTTSAYRHDFARVWRKLNRLRGASVADVLADPENPAYAELYSVLTFESDSATSSDALMIGPNARTFVSQGAQSVMELRGDTGPLSHRVEGGVRLHQDSVHREHREDAFLVQGGELVPEGSPTLTTTVNDAATLAFAAHALDAVSFHDLTLTPGVRLEVIHSELDDLLEDTRGTRTLSVLMPGVGAYYALTDELGVLAGVHRGFSPPPPGSPQYVAPEHSVNFEGGARYSRGQSRVELIGFYNDYQNLTDVCTLASGCLDDDLDRQFDAGEARIYGLEAYAAHAFELGDVRTPVSLAYTYSHGEFESDFVSQDPIYGAVERGDELPYLPQHQLAANVAVEVGRVSGFVALQYVAAMREEAGTEPLDAALTTDEQLTLDLGAALELGAHVRVYFDVRNLLEAQDLVARRPYGARPNAPRWFHAGMKLAL